MITETFTLLKEQLNAYIKLKSGINDDKVMYVDGSITSNESMPFQNNAITPLLINIKEERVLRKPDRHLSLSGSNLTRNKFPEIRIELLILFVSRFVNYEQSLQYLSLVIQYFQSHRILNKHNSPTMPATIDQLIIELQSLPIQEQNELWNALRTSYLPSVAYRVGVLVFNEKDNVTQQTNIEQINYTTSMK